MEEVVRDKKYWVPPLCDKEYVINEEECFSIAAVGDLHLHASTPKSRIDDYPDTSIAKLAILRKELKERGIRYLFLPGDIFHVSKERSDYEYRVIEEFRNFKRDGIRVFVITGNHDLQFDRLDTVEKSTLGILYLTETVYPFVKVTFNRGDKTKIVVTGLHFPNEVQPVTEFEAYNVLCCHKFFNMASDKDSILKKNLDDYGYNMYICGHDHMPYDAEVIRTNSGNVTVVRPGSFMRGTSHSYNTKRLVYMDEIRFNGKVEVVRNTLPVKEPEEIFPASVTDKMEDAGLKEISKKLSELVSKMYEISDNNLDIYSILDESPVDFKVKERIVMYLEASGIFRKRNVVDNLEGGN